MAMPGNRRRMTRQSRLLRQPPLHPDVGLIHDHQARDAFSDHAGTNLRRKHILPISSASDWTTIEEVESKNSMLRADGV